MEFSSTTGEPTVACSKCGHRQHSKYEFCSQCGTSTWGKKRPRKKHARRSNPAVGVLGVPWWGWLVGAAAVYFLFLRKPAPVVSKLAALTDGSATLTDLDLEGYGRYGRF